MDYLSHYNRLVQRGKSRSLHGYVERHHIVPRCMGGGDEKENIVELTAEEHFVAHQLLVKMYPSVGALATVTVLMAKKARSNKFYGWLRRRNAAALSGMTERNRKISAALVGNTYAKAHAGKKRAPFSDEWKMNISRGKKGQSPWIKGRKHSEETRKKMAASKLGNKNRLGGKKYFARLSAAEN